MLADAAGARRVRGQSAGLLNRPQIGGVETGNRGGLVDLRLIKRASAVMTGLHWLAIGRSGGRSEGLVNTCTNHRRKYLMLAFCGVHRP